MTDDADKQDAEDAGDAEAKPLAGERLAEARRAKQISVVEIAKELHLDEPKVRALERNEFEALGAPVFAKGHLKKYAQLVGIDFDDVVADYYALNREPPAPLVINTQVKVRRELSPGPWIAVIIVLVLAAAAYWWFTTRPPVTTPVVAPVMDVIEVPADDTVTPDGELAGDQPIVDTAPEEVTADSAEETLAMPADEPDDGLLELGVNYSGDCWTEITDGAGKRLYFGLGKDGRTVSVSGEPPLNVLFGDADNVSVLVNGTPRTIRASERRGKTARFSIAQP